MTLRAILTVALVMCAASLHAEPAERVYIELALFETPEEGFLPHPGASLLVALREGEGAICDTDGAWMQTKEGTRCALRYRGAGITGEIRLLRVDTAHVQVKFEGHSAIIKAADTIEPQLASLGPYSVVAQMRPLK